MSVPRLGRRCAGPTSGRSSAGAEVGEEQRWPEGWGGAASAPRLGRSRCRSAMPCTDPAAMADAQASATAAATGGGGRRVEGGGGGGGPGAAAMRERGRREDWAEGQPPLPWEGAGRGRRTGRRAGAAAMGGRGRRKGNGEEGGATREGGENEKK